MTGEYSDEKHMKPAMDTDKKINSLFVSGQLKLNIYFQVWAKKKRPLKYKVF